MERNIMHRFKPQQYEQYLSPFGKRVLKDLVKRWKTGPCHDKTEHRRHQFCTIQNKKVLTFNNSHETNSPRQLEKLTIENEKRNCKFLENNLPVVAASVELIETINTVQDTTLRGDYLAYPDFPQGRDLVYDVYNKTSDDEALYDYKKAGDYNLHINKANDIDWDDMFDSELLPDRQTDADATSNVNLDINSYLRNDKSSEIPFSNPNDDKYNHCNVENMIKNSKFNKQSKVTDAIPRKVKKIKNDKFSKQMKDSNSADENNKLEINKISNGREIKKKKDTFRKQKYTKAVKNWLNDINNPVNEEVNSINNSANADTNKIHKIITNAKTLTKPKKVIQAQLANKDGVMKFTKPANKPVNEDKVLEKGVIKDKKIKKFIAPIKSQIPVKDVIFKVCNVEASNIEEFKLLDVMDQEIFITLIYSNGFSQLNSHHTDDMCVPDGIVINNDDIFYCIKATNSKTIEFLIHLFENNKIICYDGKAILIYLSSEFQIEINSSRIYDAQIGGSLLDPDNPPENFSELQKLLAFTPQYTVATECELQKAAWYVSLLKECWAQLSHQLMQDSLWGVFVNIETQLLPIVASMERHGVKVDLERLKCMEQILLTKMQHVEQECYDVAGKVFQINSAVQVRAILYDELQLDTKCNVKIRETICKGSKSTSETMLRSLVSVHPLPKLILEYRHLHKAHATFLAGIAQHVKDGVVRPTWVQTAAVTGRIASNNPNLQAIPKAPFSLVMFPASGDKDPEQLSFRSIYVARGGHVLLSADFKHVECRVFALAAADTGLLELLQRDDDLFRVLAAKWLQKAEAAVSGADRERTKRIVYASLYGAGARKLMDLLGVGYEQALAVVASFHSTFPCLKSFARGVAARCARGGGRLATPGGRARRFANIASADFALRSQAERQAVNFVVQGSAADVCKTAMVGTAQVLRGSSPPLRARLLLQLHDELVWELPRRQLQGAARLIKRVMEQSGRRCGLAAALPVALRCGASWGDMAELTLE